MKKIAWLLIFVGIFLGSASSFASDWIIDTDMGVDDALALLYFLKNPQLTIKGIIVESNGLASCTGGSANSQALVHLAGHPPLPVFCGSSKPMRGHHHFPRHLLKNNDKAVALFLPLEKAEKPSTSAKKWLIQTLLQAKKPVNLLLIAPLTTLAEALEEEPRILSIIHKVYLMGGALKVKGNIHEVDPKQKNQTAEWNIYLDPYAADKVFQSGLALNLIPLDVTNQVKLDQAFYEEIAHDQKTALMKYVYVLLKENQKMIRDHVWYFWDPLAAAIATDETLARFEPLPLRVLLKPESLSGTTIIDAQRGHIIQVCTEVDKERFKKDFLLRLHS